MSEISEERVEALASNILECHDVKPSEIKALAGLALLALRERAEPVAVLDIQSGRQDGNKFAMVFTRAAHTLPDDVYNLYTAPPAPVVAVETFEEWSRRCEIQLTLCRPEFREVAEITWNACRAAMLAAPGKN